MGTLDSIRLPLDGKTRRQLLESLPLRRQAAWKDAYDQLYERDTDPELGGELDSAAGALDEQLLREVQQAGRSPGAAGEGMKHAVLRAQWDSSTLPDGTAVDDIVFERSTGGPGPPEFVWYQEGPESRVSSKKAEAAGAAVLVGMTWLMLVVPFAASSGPVLWVVGALTIVLPILLYGWMVTRAVKWGGLVKDPENGVATMNAPYSAPPAITLDAFARWELAAAGVRLTGATIHFDSETGSPDWVEWLIGGEITMWKEVYYRSAESLVVDTEGLENAPQHRRIKGIILGAVRASPSFFTKGEALTHVPRGAGRFRPLPDGPDARVKRKRVGADVVAAPEDREKVVQAVSRALRSCYPRCAPTAPGPGDAARWSTASGEVEVSLLTLDEGAHRLTIASSEGEPDRQRIEDALEQAVFG